MKTSFTKKPLIWAAIAVILVQLACGTTTTNTVNNPTEENVPDYAATESALGATQQAIDEAAAQPTATTPPEPTATEAPTIAPTDMPEPTEEGPITYSSGDLMYFTDFSGSEDWEDGWVHFSLPDADYTVYKDDGVMHVEVPVTGVTVYLLYDDLYLLEDQADVYVETSFENLSTHNINQVGVVCRASGEGWYEFNLLSGGMWYIYKFDSNDGYYSLLKEGGIADLDYDAEHSIGALCKGNQLAFYLDGSMVKNSNIQDNSFNEGGVGLAAFAVDQWPDVIIDFDYFGAEVP
ncbi:hypothetical protein KQH61_04365 [bacterium]|nr:hypothetical protein [bacterium]MCB2179138.1 hypothetical protein [bacterium]